MTEYGENRIIERYYGQYRKRRRQRHIREKYKPFTKETSIEETILLKD